VYQFQSHAESVVLGLLQSECLMTSGTLLETSPGSGEENSETTGKNGHPPHHRSDSAAAISLIKLNLASQLGGIPIFRNS
jgi:hypothetical protein